MSDGVIGPKEEKAGEGAARGVGEGRREASWRGRLDEAVKTRGAKSPSRQVYTACSYPGCAMTGSAALAETAPCSWELS